MKKILSSLTFAFALNAAMTAEDFSGKPFVEQEAQIQALGAAAAAEFEDFRIYVRGDGPIPATAAALKAAFPEGLDLEALNKAYEDLHDPVMAGISSIAGDQGHVHIPVSEEQWGHFKLGLGLLVNDGSHVNEHIYKGLEKCFKHLTGQKTTPMFLTINPAEDDGDEVVGQTAETLSAELPQTEEERREYRANLGKAISLYYTAILSTDLTKKTLRAWDFLEVAGWSALLTRGKENIHQHLYAYALAPLGEQMQQMTRNAKELSQILDMEAFRNGHGGGIPEELKADRKKAFLWVIREQASVVAHALMMNYFDPAGHHHRTLESGMTGVRLAKAFYYKHLCDAATSLYIREKSDTEIMQIVQEIMADDYQAQEMENLFLRDEETREILGPNWNCWLWGELVFGYEKYQELSGRGEE